jgi:hypothetical protein
MKQLSAAAVLGIIAGLAIIYWIRPIKPANAILLTLICIGLMTIIIKGGSRLFGRRKKNDADVKM